MIGIRRARLRLRLSYCRNSFIVQTSAFHQVEIRLSAPLRAKTQLIKDDT